MTTAAIVPADLEVLCSALLRRLPLDTGDPAHLVHVVLPGAHDTGGPLGLDDEVDLGIARLAPDAHPLEVLFGAEAPPEWAALGVVAVGTVRQSADPTLLDTRVRSAHLVERGGGWAAAFAPIGGGGAGEDSSSGPPGTEAPNGRIDDALRLALGLPTPPPPSTTLELFTVQWLDRLVDEAAKLRAGDRRRCTEAWAISRHPAVEAFALGGVAVDVDGHRLVAEARRLADWRDWPELRRMCATGGWEHPELTAGDAAWLDDGAFSRWALAAWPDLECLADVLVALLPPRTARLVHGALDAWGFPVDPAAELEEHETT